MVLKYSYDFWEAADVRCTRSPLHLCRGFQFLQNRQGSGHSLGQVPASDLTFARNAVYSSWTCHTQCRCSINGTYTHFIDWTFPFVITKVYFTYEISSLGHSVLEEFLKACQLILPLIAGLVINSFFNGDERSH